jgi:L-asparaginase II
MLSCKACGGQHSEMAAACPHCGEPHFVAGFHDADRNVSGITLGALASVITVFFMKLLGFD